MFLHGWAIAIGGLALALPVVIHWLTRPRPVRLPISTLRFVREAVHQRRARHRLRDVLVLTLRTLAVALLAAALARPLIGRARQASGDDAADVVRVVVLDISQSMGATSQGIAHLERARPLAARALDYRSGLKAHLILGGARPRTAFDSPSTNFGALQESLAAAVVRAERFDVQAALNLAAEVLARVSDTDARRELLVISDFQRTNWAVADLSVLPRETVVTLESAAPAEPPANLALLNVRTTGRVEAGHEANLAVDVGNYSGTPRQVNVDVELGDVVSRLSGLCAPNSRTTLTSTVQVPDAGWRSGAARLASIQDALAADNVRYCALHSRPPPVFAIVTRERSDVRPSVSYFFERALSAMGTTAAGGAPHVVRIDPDQFDAGAFERADLLLFVHPGRLSTDMLQRLRTMLRRGCGALYVAADAVDAVNLQQIAATNPDLPLPVDYQPPPRETERAGLFLTDIARSRAVFAVFGDQAAEATGALRFAGGLGTRRRPSGLADDVLATFNDQSAFLVVSESDGGRLAVLNADLMRSDLPRSPVFVPMLSELLQAELLVTGEGSLTFAAGEPVYAALIPANEGTQLLELVPPAGSESGVGRLLEEAGSVVWQADAAGPPGVYELRRGAEVLAAAVTAIPEEESDLQSIAGDVLRERLSGGRKVVYRAGATDAASDLETMWTWLILACVLCVLAELVTLRAFRT